MSRKEFIDTYINKAISKTLTVMAVATVGLFTKDLNGTEWTIIAAIYIGSTKTTETILKLQNKS